MESAFLTAFDIGTNTVLSLTARRDPDGRLTPCEERFRTTRLGQDVQRTGRLQPDAVGRTLDALRDFHEHVRGTFAAGCGIAVATSAARDAANGPAFLRECRDLLGGAPTLLSGEEEARTVFRGATASEPPGTSVVSVDIGGGSTELSAGTPGCCVSAESANVGCVRLTELFGLEEAVPPARCAEARAWVRARFVPLCKACSAPVGGRGAFPVVASGGTATTLSAWRQGLDHYLAERVHGFVLTREQVEACAREVCALPAAGRAELACVTPGRAPVFAAGLLILAEVLACLQAPAVKVTARGLRYGLLCRLADAEFAPTWTWGEGRFAL